VGLLLFFSYAGYAYGLTSIEAKSAVARIVLGNTAVRLAALDYRIAQAEADAGWVDFETQFTVRPEYRSERQLSNSTLESSTYLETTGSFSVGLKRKFSIGTQAELVFQEMWLTSNSIQTTFGDRDQAAVQAKLTQPLLKGRGHEANEATLRKVRLKAERYRLELESTMSDTIVKVLGLYLDLSASRVEVAIKVADARYYEQKRDEAKARHRLGDLPEADALAVLARHQVALAELRLSETKVLEIEEKLARETQDPALNRPMVEMSFSESELLDRTDEIDNSFPIVNNHPSMRIIALQKLETEADLGKAKSALLPQLDLSLQGSTVGAGTNHPEAEEGVFARRTPSWQVLLTFAWPLGNLSAVGEHERLVTDTINKDYLYRKQSLELSRQQAQLTRDRSKSTEGLKLAKARMTQARQIFEFKEAQFKSGIISSSDLIQARNDFSSAWQQAITAAVQLRKLNSRILSFQPLEIPSLIER
jgi:outer membrane protein TolC